MGMEQAIRNKLRSVVTQCRKRLEDAAARELEGRFSIYIGPNKDRVIIADEAGLSHLTEEDRAYRKDLLDHFEHIKALGYKDREALAQLIREIAFTHLNRLCAYKMMEARRVYVGGQRFREAVSRGINSKGVKFYLADHPEDERLFNTGHQDLAYRHFLDWLGGLLSDEIGVLFSPADPANRLYPPQRVLDEVLNLLNEAELADSWAQDETIGWVYQYFTPKELRDQARKESAAPRNSYELAFRNQFFTPRYVVEFLTDNTLGRIWYDMRQGDTQLKERCRYLVRRPLEIFLAEGEEPPRETTLTQDDLSQEELLRQPVYITHRSKKDPRELKILDPACGSGHFVLYCFDLLQIIYEEAYTDADLGPALQKDYPDLTAFRQAVPGLILKHNLHGIDIDLRATQIAALVLWLRCQRAYQEMGLEKSRPKITRSNIVCAEPMPGEKEMLREFVSGLQPKVLGQLVEVVFDKMKLAGEAGSLLKIEEEIRDAVDQAKRQWSVEPPVEQLTLFAMDAPKQERLRFDLSGLTDDQFFEQAEARVIEALKSYAEYAGAGNRFQRLLFTDDVVQGFAFIDLCRQRFDVVLMNPPFGDASIPSKPYIQEIYGDTKGDVYKSFVECFQDRLIPSGMLGMISSRTGFFLGQSTDWRRRIVLRLFRPLYLADFGSGVLDAMVETAAYVLRTLDESEDEQLTLSLLPDLLNIPTDRNHCFSIAKYQQQHGLKRHQAIGEINRLLDSRFITEVPGHFRRFQVNSGNIKQAPQPKSASLPDLICFRLTIEQDKGETLYREIQALHNSSGKKTFVINPVSFEDVPGAPFAYWVSNRIRKLFKELRPFEGEGRTVRVGLQTSDDFRFVRAWWEVPAQQICPPEAHPTEWVAPYCVVGYRWFPFAKGGEYSPYYADLHLVVNWEQGGEDIRNFDQAFIRNENFYFQPGLTWAYRTHRLCLQELPSCVIISVRGSGVFADSTTLQAWLSLGNSLALDFLVKIAMGRGGHPQFDQGDLKLMPYPRANKNQLEALIRLGTQCLTLEKTIATSCEVSMCGVLPALFQVTGMSLADRIANWKTRIAEVEREETEVQKQIDEIVYQLYGIEGDDRQAIEEFVGSRQQQVLDEEPFKDNRENEEIDAGEVKQPLDDKLLAADMLSYAAGCIFGRWDVRFATGERAPPELPDPFAPLPVCSPGMLQGPDGLPVKEAPEGYPLRIDGDGIMVDDPDHSDDIVRRVREVLEVIWQDRAEAIEKEACEILGVKDLRDYFRRPGKGGFWDDHIARYSKSRRKAPIYWLLQSSRKNYALWIYYHRLDNDILFKALLYYVEPKVRLEESRLESLRSQRTAAGETSKGVKVLDKEIERQEDFLSELRDFEEKLRRAANLHLEPDLNDGVVLNIAPLHELVPWKEAKRYWEELRQGEYEWSSIGKQLRRKGLVSE